MIIPLRKTAVITPYFQEPKEWILRMLKSVQMQTEPGLICHILVSDGRPQEWIDRWLLQESSTQREIRHIRLDRSHSDFGNTPRAIGALLAVSEQYDAITYLDADNWYEPDHILSCWQAIDNATFPVDWVIAQRRLVRVDGTVLPLDNPEDKAGTLVDTNCMFLLKGAFHTVSRWATMPKPMTVIGDRVMLMGLNYNKLNKVQTDRVTVNYLCTYAIPFRILGEVVPDYAKSQLNIDDYQTWLSQLSHREHEIAKRLCGFPFQIKKTKDTF